MAVRRVTTATKVLRALTRPALFEDLPELAQLLSTYGQGTTEEDLAHFLRSGGQMVVATVLGEVAGVAVLEWLHPIQSPRAQAWLTSLITNAQFRHRGVARALLEEAARRVRQSGADRLHITAVPERDDVRAFLAAAGFEPHLLVYERMV